MNLKSTNYDFDGLKITKFHVFKKCFIKNYQKTQLFDILVFYDFVTCHKFMHS